MKEMTVIEDFVCNDNCKRKDCEVCFKARSKKEQVPENWGDFLELCKILKKVFISANGYYVEFNKLRFYMDGTVEFNGVIIKIVVGVSRMWQIIKSLIGEE